MRKIFSPILLTMAIITSSVFLTSCGKVVPPREGVKPTFPVLYNWTLDQNRIETEGLSFMVPSGTEYNPSQKGLDLQNDRIGMKGKVTISSIERFSIPFNKSLQSLVNEKNKDLVTFSAHTNERIDTNDTLRSIGIMRKDMIAMIDNKIVRVTQEPWRKTDGWLYADFEILSGDKNELYKALWIVLANYRKWEIDNDTAIFENPGTPDFPMQPVERSKAIDSQLFWRFETDSGSNAFTGSNKPEAALMLVDTLANPNDRMDLISIMRSKYQKEFAEKYKDDPKMTKEENTNMEKSLSTLQLISAKHMKTELYVFYKDRIIIFETTTSKNNFSAAKLKSDMDNNFFFRNIALWDSVPSKVVREVIGWIGFDISDAYIKTWDSTTATFIPMFGNHLFWKISVTSDTSDFADIFAGSSWTGVMALAVLNQVWQRISSKAIVPNGFVRTVNVTKYQNVTIAWMPAYQIFYEEELADGQKLNFIDILIFRETYPMVKYSRITFLTSKSDENLIPLFRDMVQSIKKL